MGQLAKAAHRKPNKKPSSQSQSFAETKNNSAAEHWAALQPDAEASARHCNITRSTLSSCSSYVFRIGYIYYTEYNDYIYTLVYAHITISSYIISLYHFIKCHNVTSSTSVIGLKSKPTRFVSPPCFGAVAVADSSGTGISLVLYCFLA